MKYFAQAQNVKLNPSLSSRQSRISSRSDFIHAVDLFRRKTDLTKKDIIQNE